MKPRSPPLWALPGRENIGLGRHWHGLSVMLWVLNGLVYVVLLFATGLWRRIIPTSWSVSPEALDSLKTYLGFRVRSIEHFQPYDALQMLGYTFVVFVLAPFLMLTGLAMAPAIRSRFPWYVKLWGGHQGARSLHFIAMVLMTGFIVMHVGLVFLVHPAHNVAHMMIGDVETARAAQVAFTEVGRKAFLNRIRPRSARQKVYTDADVSKFHWTNGLPPTQEESIEWLDGRDTGWENWSSTIGDDITGASRTITLDEIKGLPQTSYIAVHTCMQGWSATSRWTGVRLSDLLDLLGPRPPEARYVLVAREVGEVHPVDL